MNCGCRCRGGKGMFRSSEAPYVEAFDRKNVIETSVGSEDLVAPTERLNDPKEINCVEDARRDVFPGKRFLDADEFPILGQHLPHRVPQSNADGFAEVELGVEAEEVDKQLSNASSTSNGLQSAEARADCRFEVP